MVSLKRVLAAAVCGAMAFALVSCGDYVGKEKSHPLYMKGGTCRSSGNYKDAAKYFEEFLLICPKSAKANYELATLYGDNLDEPIKAIYHYQRFLDLSPADAPDVASVKQFIELTKKKAFDKLNEEYKVTPESEKTAKELAETKAKLDKYIVYAQQLKEQNALMKQRLIGGKGAAPAGKASAAAPSPTGAAPAADNAKKAKTDLYKTKAGDTFESIAKQLLGSASHAKLIRDANKGVPATGKLKPGTELKIPALPVKGGTAAKTAAPAAAPAAVPAPAPAPAQSTADELGVGVPQD
jgi:tetratricopeptide (TPR) repeat protein